MEKIPLLQVLKKARIHERKGEIIKVQKLYQQVLQAFSNHDSSTGIN